MLSGHVHGGIMRLPLVGGVISPAYTLFPKYDGGIFHSGKTTMLLGRGMDRIRYSFVSSTLRSYMLLIW